MKASHEHKQLRLLPGQKEELLVLPMQGAQVFEEHHHQNL
jgi:hypothetical protein